ncbi:AtpZ/AtpI family protein [bacterium]|nr:AtpZ/AtpI family protein [bacterium]
MADRNPALIRQLWQASMAGIMLAACIFVGTGIGVWLDRWLGTRPWLTIGFMLLGIVAGFYNVFKIVSALNNPRRLK